ncbi:heme A synthase [Diaminobutyricimonas sp. LJ205]|uniref:COX15/CtaA family protein n=1 Tax=Diaminobutyricimonas sp. LJ205 TaxID=2683590 RepID=UPI0012F4B7C6|nr:COX15/CtaA family protein [Diaminobutyricimonas sp. LJ205]
MPLTSSPTAAPVRRNRFYTWLPEAIDRRIKVFAWLSFFTELAIIGTGGAVRLTGSGLGCPTWPTCTPDSLIPTAEMGIHGVIEFGNRTMTGVLSIVAVIMLVLLWRIRAERRDLFSLAIVLLGGILAQAIVGGVTVWTGLNPVIVGFHYVVSLGLVCVAAALVYRVYSPAGRRERIVPRWYAIVSHVSTLLLAVTIAFGVLTTGAGPHSGDAAAGRNGFNAELLQHIHAWPAYALFALTIVLIIGAWRMPRLRSWTIGLLVVELVQVAVGIYQARNGLPELAVGVHMVLAALLAAVMTVVLLAQKRPVA